MQGPLPLDGLLGAEMTSFLKIENVLKSSFGVSVKVHISHQKMCPKVYNSHSTAIIKSKPQ